MSSGTPEADYLISIGLLKAALEASELKCKRYTLVCRELELLQLANRAISAENLRLVARLQGKL